MNDSIPIQEQGNDANNVFIGNVQGGEVFLRGGDDIFIPNAINDDYNVSGSDGNDTIIGGLSGADVLKGENGNDTIIASNGVAEVVAGDGDDWVQIDGQGRGINIKNTASGNNGSDVVIGGAVNDFLYGTARPSALNSIRAASPSDSDTLFG